LWDVFFLLFFARGRLCLALSCFFWEEREAGGQNEGEKERERKKNFPARNNECAICDFHIFSLPFFLPPTSGFLAEVVKR
jgi:hypothetical protein